MSPGRSSKPAVLAVLVSALALSACGGGDQEANTEVTVPKPQFAQTDSRLPPPEHPAEVDAVQGEIDRQLQAERETKREEAKYTSTPFEKAVERLPLHKPPLYAEQVILDGTHQLVVGIETKRSFCKRTAAQRTAAVQSFYEKADTLMRARKITDFTLDVIPLETAATPRNRLARAAGGTAKLTARGQTADVC